VADKLKLDNVDTDEAYQKADRAGKQEDEVKQRIATCDASIYDPGHTQSTTDNGTATPYAIATLSLLSLLLVLLQPTKQHTLGRLLALFNPTPTTKVEELTDVCIQLLDMDSGCTITKVTTDFFCR
jgi:hypothetical protein